MRLRFQPFEPAFSEDTGKHLTSTRNSVAHCLTLTAYPLPQRREDKSIKWGKVEENVRITIIREYDIRQRIDVYTVSAQSIEIQALVRLKTEISGLKAITIIENIAAVECLVLNGLEVMIAEIQIPIHSDTSP